VPNRNKLPRQFWPFGTSGGRKKEQTIRQKKDLNKQFEEEREHLLKAEHDAKIKCQDIEKQVDNELERTTDIALQSLSVKNDRKTVPVYQAGWSGRQMYFIKPLTNISDFSELANKQTNELRIKKYIHT
jgi:hypothetical protein